MIKSDFKLVTKEGGLLDIEFIGPIYVFRISSYSPKLLSGVLQLRSGTEVPFKHKLRLWLIQT